MLEMPRDFGPWQELKSKAGKIYYWNRLTQKSQWSMPPEWAEHIKAAEHPEERKKKVNNESISSPALPAVATTSRSELPVGFNPSVPPPSIGHSEFITNGTNTSANHNGSSRHHKKSPRHANEGSKPKVVVNGASSVHSTRISEDSSTPDERKLQEVSSDDESLEPPWKKSRQKWSPEDAVVKVVPEEQEPMDMDIVSEDDEPCASTVRSVDSRDSSSEVRNAVTDEELERILEDVGAQKFRVPELDHLDVDIKKLAQKQYECERDVVDVIKDQISLRQLLSNAQIVRRTTDIRSNFAKQKADALDNSGFL